MGGLEDEIEENPERYLRLPTKFEIHEYHIMEEFILTLKGKRADKLECAIRGRGAFRRFGDMVDRMEISQQWYDFQAEYYRKLAIEWCREQGLEYAEEEQVKIRFAEKSDIEILSIYDKHIQVTELQSVVSLGRVIVAEDNGTLIGWLRWNLFWDNTPFMNMLFILEQYRINGYGKAMVSCWEEMMQKEGHQLVMTSSLSNETAQYFYRKLNYVDSGALLLPEEPLEIIFVKKI